MILPAAGRKPPLQGAVIVKRIRRNHTPEFKAKVDPHLTPAGQTWLGSEIAKTLASWRPWLKNATDKAAKPKV
ncbi:MAG TPA: hypothetical protein DHU55_14435 [Blastocatellia bacterium]|nr:hypothetical protein [Blastocatellia bacterium]